MMIPGGVSQVPDAVQRTIREGFFRQQHRDVILSGIKGVGLGHRIGVLQRDAFPVDRERSLRPCRRMGI